MLRMELHTEVWLCLMNDTLISEIISVCEKNFPFLWQRCGIHSISWQKKRLTLALVLDAAGKTFSLNTMTLILAI